MSDRRVRSLYVVSAVYLICFAFRIWEYFVLRTDQTFWGEAFLHKLIGIGILVICMKQVRLKPGEIGFVGGKAVFQAVPGLAFGAVIFTFAYTVECLVLASQGRFAALEWYVSAYTAHGNVGRQTAGVFFLICIIGNIVNVLMEEGIFRGLFQRLLENRHAFLLAAVVASALFGIWHVTAPVRSYCDGTMSLGGMIANIIMLVTTSGLVGFKFAMMTKLTGSLYMAMGDHFVNNTIVNMLHVVSDTGADELMVVRISIAQSVSFTVVLVWYIIRQYKKRVVLRA